MPPAYEPLFAPLCAFLAFGAVPLAALIRRLGGHTAHAPLPDGWGTARTLRVAAGLVALAVTLDLLPVVLQPIGQQLLALAPEPTTVGGPAWIEAGLAGLLVAVAELAWQLALLTAPLGVALVAVTRLRWPRAWLATLAAVATAPAPALLLVASLPADAGGGWARLTAGLATLGGLGATLLARRHLLRRWRAWRRPPIEVTRVSVLPAHLATRLRLEQMEAPTRRTPPPTSMAAAKRA